MRTWKSLKQSQAYAAGKEGISKKKRKEKKKMLGNSFPKPHTVLSWAKFK